MILVNAHQEKESTGTTGAYPYAAVLLPKTHQDPLYNNGKRKLSKDINEEARNFIENFPRQALHSYKIKFSHPITDVKHEFEINMPNDMVTLTNYLKKI